MSKTKPFTIGRQQVMNAYLRVRANKGRGGVDEISLEMFDKNAKNYLYKIWNQMSSGSYMPPPVMLVEIPKKERGRFRPLGIPTVADRIAQTVVAELLERELDPMFDEDSYGYRFNKSAIQALEQTRKRCWKYAWVVDVDIKGFFDNLSHELLMKAVRKHIGCKWMLLYIERWLVAPVQLEDGTLVKRTKGVPQGSVVGPVLANLYLHYATDIWLRRNFAHCPFERFADDSVIHCKSELAAREVKEALERRLKECGLELNAQKTKIVYCKDSNRRGKYPTVHFDFLGYTFKPRQAKNSHRNESFTNCLPAVSNKSLSSMREKMKKWETMKLAGSSIEEVATEINPVVRGWINYYGKFYTSKLKTFMREVNLRIVKWARSKYLKIRPSVKKGLIWLKGVSLRKPNLFAHWKLLGATPMVKIIGAV
jgi:RNA-directed DNA polymerase